MRWRILMTAALALVLWAAQPAVRTLHRGFRDGKSTGAFVFSMVLAGGRALAGSPEAPRACQR